LLKELEEFAFRGCPDMNKANLLVADTSTHEKIIEEQRLKQKDLIDQLKNQLIDLESYAYQSGTLEIPSTLIMEKQRVIIDELKEKINLPIENMNKLSNDELKKAVDSAICQVNILIYF
jgi:RUN domain-containing protein 1